MAIDEALVGSLVIPGLVILHAIFFGEGLDLAVGVTDHQVKVLHPHLCHSFSNAADNCLAQHIVQNFGLIGLHALALTGGKHYTPDLSTTLSSVHICSVLQNKSEIRGQKKSIYHSGQGLDHPRHQRKKTPPRGGVFKMLAELVLPQQALSLVPLLEWLR